MITCRASRCSLAFIFLLLSLVVASPKKHSLVESLPATFVTTSNIVDDTPAFTRCPQGFSPLADQCVATVTVKAEIRCASGHILVDNKCAKFFGKTSECPPSYKHQPTSSNYGGECFREIIAEPDIACPEDFYLTQSEDECVRHVRKPDVTACSPGSVPKGDHCARQALVAPRLSCHLANAVLQGKVCTSEEIFDCTPRGNQAIITGALTDLQDLITPTVVVPTARVVQPDHITLPDHSQKISYFRRVPDTHPVVPAEKKSNTTNSISASPVGHRRLREKFGNSIENSGSPYSVAGGRETLFITARTCKRLLQDAARETCDEGMLVKDGCLTATPETFVTKLGGFEEDKAPVRVICPPDYVNSCDNQQQQWIKKIGSRKCTCKFVHETPGVFICPAGATDVGTKCATYGAFTYGCPVGFKLTDDNKCSKTLVSPPITEYTVTYQCTGLGCAAAHEANRIKMINKTPK